MGQKTAHAFKFTMNTLAKDNKQKDLYMWTFTWRKAQAVKESAEQWSKFVHDRSSGLTASFPSMSGLRVFEMHPGIDGRSHGLHVHLVTDEFLPIDIIRLKWNKFADGGRIHVVKVKAQAAHYIDKYLCKERDECLRGYRLWSAIGKCNNTRNSDIVVHSEFTDAYKFMASAITGFTRLSFGTRAVLVRRFMMGGSIAEAFAAQGIQQDHWQQVKQEMEYYAGLNDRFDGAFDDE